MSFSWTLPPPSSSPVAAVFRQQNLLLGKDIFFNGDFAITAAKDFGTVEGLTALRAAIYRRLMTNPGEYRARPEYGVGVRSFVKKRRTLSTLDELKQRIGDQLSLDPRIQDVVDIVISNIQDGLQIVVVVSASGKTLRFEPFDFTERQLVDTIPNYSGKGITIGGIQ